MSRRVSMDIGGTFTDVIVYDDETGTYESGKVSTTPADFADGVLEGLAASVRSTADIGFFVHGTTVGINAFLERRGERLLLLTNAGIRDVYHIARGSRLRMYDLHYRKPTPLIPLTDIEEIRGRLDFRGNEIEPIADEDVEAAAARAQRENIRSIAVVLLFSFVNPDHELHVEQLLRRTLPDASISLSHRVANEWREYERTSSTVLNAYIAPRVEHYLERLGGELSDRGMPSPLHVMQSSGGVISAERARRRPLYTLMSGPVGGTIGGVALSSRSGHENLLCVDMGGTSFDVSLVVAGRPDVSSEVSLEGFPVLMPMVNIHTVGAGGGSLAYIEAGGLRVGPESAGASPGPVCYGRGGTQPSVTDANLVLGRLDPEYFLDGRMQLDVPSAEHALEELASQLDLEMLELAEGIVDVINAKMAQAIRTITVEKGIEPREFALLAFGGAGPLHAAFLAEELEIPEVIVPRYPGAFSAWGMLQTALRHDAARPFYRSVDSPELRIELAALTDELADEGQETLAGEGVPSEAVELTFSAEMRYVGQEYTVTVEFDRSELDGPGFASAILARFHEAHDRRYGHANPQAPAEFVICRLGALGDLGRKPSSRLAPNGRGRAAGDARRRTAIFDRKPHDTAVVHRVDLPPGTRIEGPAIIEEPTATTVVPPGVKAEIDSYGSIRLKLGGRS